VNLRVTLDGTEIQANASKHKAMSPVRWVADAVGHGAWHLV